MHLPVYNWRAESDEALIKASRIGTDAAFEELMKRYVEPIYKFSRQYTKTKEDAEDITQDTFYKAWKNLDKFEEGKTFRPWLYTVARNTALDYVKKRHSIVFSDLDDVEEDTTFAETIADTELLPNEVFEQKQIANRLDELMADFHPDHKAVIVMHYHQEMTFEEIALALNKPMNTVKSWHRRSLIKIKEKLLHQDKELGRNQ